MNFLFKHNLNTISFLALIPIYFSCSGNAINVKENKKIADELISGGQDNTVPGKEYQFPELK